METTVRTNLLRAAAVVAPTIVVEPK